MKRYQKFKMFYETKEGIYLNIFELFLWSVSNLDPILQVKLRYVRIYFDTPTFDRITKDRADKFADMLSTIGGTMGLLTGFSLISAVEILYFAIKIACNMFMSK